MCVKKGLGFNSVLQLQLCLCGVGGCVKKHAKKMPKIANVLWFTFLFINMYCACCLYQMGRKYVGREVEDEN